MTEKELRKLSRADLLEMLIDQGEELRRVKEELEAAEAALRDREIKIDTAGSIAEAALQLNGIFEAAQASCEQYTENIRKLSARQESVCRRLEQESKDRAARQLAETKLRCAELEAETKAKCVEMTTKAKMESQKYWDDVSAKRDAYYEEHMALRELLAMPLPKRDV